MESSARSYVLVALQTLRRLIGWALLLVISGFVLMFLLQIPHSPRVDHLRVIVILKDWANPVIAEVASWAGATWPARSLSFAPLILAFGVWLVKLGIDATLQAAQRAVLRKMKRVRAVSEEVLAQLEGRITADSERTREQLLRKYRDIEQALKASRRKRCAFLSVDVVGSTEMKNAEEETAIAATFQAYDEMLRQIFEKHGAWKTAWTPDGVMVCFLQLDLAAAAAQRILECLPEFNRTHNKLQTPFRVRCGLNEGEVAIFEDSKLEKVADHTIDVAGHMQKNAQVNTLWLGEPVYEALGHQEGFIPLDRTMDGLRVYEWSLAARRAMATPAAVVTNRIGRYEILEELGRGAAGIVFKAKDPQIGRTVAIRLLPRGNRTPEELEEDRQRFFREAESAAGLSHAGIVRIYNLGEDAEGQPYVVTEYVEGMTLERWLAPDGPEEFARSMDLKETFHFAWQVADALDYAHKRNVVHRALRPTNILVTREGKAKIADFGVARTSGTPMNPQSPIVGMPDFRAPEQFRVAGCDARSDIFSFGVTLYWMVTGKRPFSGSAPDEVAHKVVHTHPAPARKLNPKLPPGIDVVLSRCLAKDPKDRYASARDLAADLEAIRYGRPLSSAPLPTTPTPAN